VKPKVLGLCMYPACPQYNGGSTRVYRLAGAVSSAFDVTYYAQSARPNVLVRPRWSSVSPSYRECAAIDPLSFIGEVTGRLVGIPQLAQSATLALAAPRWLRAEAQSAAILAVEQPWQFRWAERMRGPHTKLVYDAHNVEAQMFDVDHVRLPRPLAARLVASIEGQERDAVRRADRVLATSDEDARTMSERYDVARERIEVVPNGVDCSRVRPCTDDEKAASKRALGFEGRDVVLFCGAKHGPNRGAVEAILRWADRWRDRPVTFAVVGSVGTWFSDVRSPNVVVTGFVPDVLPYYRAADVLVNPMTTGGGTNLKQLEYLASGVPSVTTAFGARGIAIRDGREAIIREVDAIPAAVEMILRNPEIGTRIRTNAPALARQHFDWAVIGERLVSIYRELLADAGSRDRSA
jgi:glycosyltransferase involved in cell wall biosynthesis